MVHDRLTGFAEGISRPVRQLLLRAGAAALWLLVMSPYLTNGFWGDDALNSSLWGEVHRDRTSLWHFIQSVNSSWAASSGRFFPVAVTLGYGGFYLLRPLWLFRTTQVLFVALNVLAFASVLRKLKARPALLVVFAGVLTALFQIRPYHDPIASFGQLLQWAFLFFCGAAYFLLRSFDGRSPRSRIASALAASLFVALGLSLYEVNLALCLVLFWLVARHSPTRKNLAIASLAVLVPLLTYGCVSAYLRSHATGVYAGVALGPIAKAPATLLKQVLAALPLSYCLATLPSHPPAWTLLRRAVLDSSEGWVILAGSGFFFWRTFRRLARSRLPRGRGSLALLELGVLLWVVPALPIAVSDKYQHELSWGVGYLPVYISYFGVALVLSVGLSPLLRRGRVLSIGTLALAFAMLICVNRELNHEQAEREDAGLKYPRVLLETALEQGLLGELNEGDRLIVGRLDRWMSSPFIFQHSGKRVVLENVPDTAWLKMDLGNPSSRAYYLDYWNPPGSTEGWVQLSRLDLAQAVPQRTLTAADACRSSGDRLEVLDFRDAGPAFVVWSEPCGGASRKAPLPPGNPARLEWSASAFRPCSVRIVPARSAVAIAE